MQKHLVIPLKGALLKGFRNYEFFGMKDDVVALDDAFRVSVSRSGINCFLA